MCQAVRIEAFANQMARKLKRYSLTIDTVDHAEQEICNFLLEESDGNKDKQYASERAILRSIDHFKTNFPEVTSEMGTSLETLEEYLQLKSKIEQDDLPRHEQNFKNLMNEKIIQAISFFKIGLEKQEEKIKNSIDDLNQSLRQINYTDSTYIELRYETTRDREIHDFKRDLKTCFSDVARYSTEDNEERFRNIQTLLIKRFQEEDRWTNKVIDVRNWLDFSVSERYKADNTEKEHHTDSSGKSGGQKAKLAYTILASAIAYQFGIDREDKRAKSFRFVVIDEAFSKSDDDNARYAMELFKNLNLQLLVVTPKDKINVIESYISSLHFVSNNTEGNYSRIISIPIEEYQQERQAALSKSYD